MEFKRPDASPENIFRIGILDNSLSVNDVIGLSMLNAPLPNVILLAKPVSKPVRITSYNVCYTKLLRINIAISKTACNSNRIIS